MDSIIYLSMVDKQQYQLPTGCCLGEMTNELCEYGSASYITEFISGGPKKYPYRLYSPPTKQYHHVIKVGGITLSSDAMKKMNNVPCLREIVHKGDLH
uniref:Uncharacterized protein n=1 Tax=Romanomermis culicivorax TaxID=13658 RepID=A0A915KV88_ROMCU